MPEGLLQSNFEASLPLLEAASEELHPGKGLGDVGRLQRVAILDELPGVVNLRQTNINEVNFERLSHEERTYALLSGGRTLGSA